MDPRPPHLALFAKSLAGGGAQRVVVNLATEFARRGHRVDLVLARAEGPLLDELTEGVRVVDLATRGRLAGLPAIFRLPRDASVMLAPYAASNPPLVYGAIPALVRYLRAETPVAMLSAVDFTNLAALWAQRLAAGLTRQVVSVHNPLSQVVAGLPNRRFRSLASAIRRLFPDADGIATCSRGVADDLARFASLDRASITPIWNPIVSRQTERLARERPEHRFFDDVAGDAGPVVIGIGRLSIQKDFALLIRAFARARRERPLRLLILGEGPERAALEALVRELDLGRDVALPGYASNPLAALAAASLFVSSSAWEGFGNVLVEALACGCPIVATDHPGPREILAEGRFGVLVEHGDEAALAKAMLERLDRPTEKEREKEKEKERLRDRAQVFDVAASADRYLALLLGRDSSALDLDDGPSQASSG